MADANKLRAYFHDKPLSAAFSSDRKRVLQTAAIATHGKGLAVQPDQDLRSLDVGYLGGEKKSEHQDEMKYFQNNPDVEIPNGDSLNSFRDHVTPAILRGIRVGHQNVDAGNGPSINFVHSSVIHELGNVLHGDHNFATVKPGGVAAVTWDGKDYKAHALVRPKKERTYGS